MLAGGATAACTKPPIAAGECPAADANRDGGTIIDWTPFVVVGTVMFTARYADGEVLADRDVGAAVATVRCRISGAVDDPDFRPRDGDAAFLPAGTTLHQVVGAPVTEKLAAREDGAWRLFTAVDS